jgi:hypothetical protein
MVSLRYPPPTEVSSLTIKQSGENQNFNRQIEMCFRYLLTGITGLNATVLYISLRARLII